MVFRQTSLEGAWAWAWLVCALGCAASAAAQTTPAAAPEAAPAPVPFDPSPIIGVPNEPSSPPVDPSPSEPAATPEVPAPAQPEPTPLQPSAAPTPPAAATSQARPRAPDPERPPTEAPAGIEDAGFSARLSLGIGAALWIAGSELKLSKPVSLGIDLGYALNKRLALIVRGSTWLRDGELANEFLGAGAVYRITAAHLYLAGVLGLSFTRDGTIDQWVHRVQGVALELDVGQTFALSTHTDFAVGAHFQFGTPWGGTDLDAFTSLHAGVFVALALR
jgi:hypothetical protein